MPEPDVVADLSAMQGEWGALRLTGPGRLRLTSDALAVEAAGGSIVVRYDDLRGGGWRTGALTIHAESGRVALESAHNLELAWVSLVERACPLPELARGHRLLGSRRGGREDLQARFLAPLLQARKRLEEEADLEARVTTLDARALRDRLEHALQSIARETYPLSHPDRRGLEAELEDAMAELFRGLDALESAAETFRSAPEPIRFMAWRSWVSAASAVFAFADSGWASASRLLPRPVKP